MEINNQILLLLTVENFKLVIDINICARSPKYVNNDILREVWGIK